MKEGRNEVGWENEVDGAVEWVWWRLWELVGAEYGNCCGWRVWEICSGGLRINKQGFGWRTWERLKRRKWELFFSWFFLFTTVMVLMVVAVVFRCRLWKIPGSFLFSSTNSKEREQLVALLKKTREIGMGGCTNVGCGSAWYDYSGEAVGGRRHSRQYKNT